MQKIRDDIHMIDTMLGGRPGITGVYLFEGEQPALVDTGAETSADTVDNALQAAGIGPDDLAWIVLTHVHLDHCGGAGILAQRYPKAKIVTHRRGAPHLIEPDRLVAGTEDIYGPFFSLYGGLQAVPEGRVIAAEDNHEVPIGPGRSLRLLDTPGHAPHHSVIFDDSTGTLIAGDAVGSRLGGSELFPAYPPPRVDIAAIRASLARISELNVETLCLMHGGGAVADPAADLVRSDEQAQIYAEAGMAAAKAGADHAGMAFALEQALPLSATVKDADAEVLWRVLGWERNNSMGVLGWAQHEIKKAAEAG